MQIIDRSKKQRKTDGATINSRQHMKGMYDYSDVTHRVYQTEKRTPSGDSRYTRIRSKEELKHAADLTVTNRNISRAEKYLDTGHTRTASSDIDDEYGIKYDEKERSMDIDLVGEEMGVLIGKRGQTLDSLQYLVSLVVNKDSENYIRVKVDTENYRQRRKDTLENLAKNIAYKVKRTRRSVSLEPMNPYERRIIHSALQNDKYVTTHSEGEEPFRKVVVTLKK